MLGKVFGILCLVSLVFALAGGTIADVANAVPDGASRAIEVTVSLSVI